MKPLSQFFHRRSLTLAILTLILSIFAASHGLGFSFRLSPPSVTFALWAIVLFVVAFTVCVHATVNLVRDVERGYSPGRCSLAAVLLLGAFLLLFVFGFGLVSFITRERAGSALAVVSAESARPVKVVVGKVHLHYVEQGQGEPVILLHGGQGDYRAWQPQMTALASRYRVIAYSRRYHHPNNNPVTSTNHSAVVDAEDLAGFIGELKLGKVHLLGTSYGAFTALAYALQHPDRVRSMVLAEPPVHLWVTNNARGAVLYQRFMQTVHEPAGKAFAERDDEGGMRIFIDRFDGHGAFERLPAERRRTVMENARFFKALAASSNPFPWLSKEEVQGLRMPVLIIRGEETDELHKLVTEELGRLLPKARRATIPNAGHGSPRQNAPAFNAAVSDFLAGVL